MRNNDDQKKTKLSINNAVSIVDTFNNGCLANDRLISKGGKVFFTFDSIEITEEELVFKQLTGIDYITFSVTDITTEVFLVETDQGDHRYVEFTLTNGERWLAQPYGYSGRKPRPHERYPEIEVDVFLDKLRMSEKISVSQIRSQITTSNQFDIIEIKDTDDNSNWDDDREIKLILKDSRNECTKCELDLDEYYTKYYLVSDSKHGFIVSVYMHDTPFTTVNLWLSYSNSDESE